MDRLKEFMAKKVAGVPVMYLVAGAVVILGIVAWRMKATTSATTAAASGDATDTAAAAGDNAAGSATTTTNPYTGLDTGGTVTTTTPMPSDTTTSADTTTDNDSWLKDAVTAVTAANANITPLDAQTAIQAYLNDPGTLTTAQQTIVNSAIKSTGQPPTTPVASPTTTVDATNDTWASKGAVWAANDSTLSQEGVTASVALGALTKYLNGTDRSYDEQAIVDAVIKANGLPPESINPAGKIGLQQAVKQFTVFPGKHTVKGTQDDTYKELCKLYYNNFEVPTINLMRGANPSLPSDGPFPAGTVVNVPVLHAPKFMTSTAALNTLTTIAKKNGISTATLQYLNPGMKFPIKAGLSVRVA